MGPSSGQLAVGAASVTSPCSRHDFCVNLTSIFDINQTIGEINVFEVLGHPKDHISPRAKLARFNAMK